MAHHRRFKDGERGIGFALSLFGYRKDWKVWERSEEVILGEEECIKNGVECVGIGSIEQKCVDLILNVTVTVCG
jgi:hypothetical protein